MLLQIILHCRKAHAKKQNSGRGSGKDKINRTVVETRACLPCKRVGHLVKDCRDKSAKEGWPKERRRNAEKTMTRLVDVSTISIRGSAVIRRTTREAGARSVNVAAAPPANAVTGATARTIASPAKKKKF